MMRYKRPDKKNALSLLSAAKKDIDFTLTLEVSERSGATIVRNIYESFRMLGESLLAAKGIESKDHIMPIKELLKVKVNTSRPVNIIDNLRKLRHNINYYGYIPKVIEVEDAVDTAKACFMPLLSAVNKEVRKTDKS
ncbi:hypothetical protein J4458_03965 [Candidatus Woesearchaeota archaeon]|nr:hypothetical protein [Candidatus Woesearchaeota archaeon]